MIKDNICYFFSFYIVLYSWGGKGFSKYVTKPETLKQKINFVTFAFIEVCKTVTQIFQYEKTMKSIIKYFQCISQRFNIFVKYTELLSIS